MCFRSFRFPRWSQGQLGRRFDLPPPEGRLLTPMRPCVPHRPPLRFFYLASSTSSSFIFFASFVMSMWVCVLSGSPCDGVAVLLVMKRAQSTAPKARQKGGLGGSSFSCFSFVVSSFSCLRSSYVGVCTGLLLWLVHISQIVVGISTEGDMARFRLRFCGCLRGSCPAPKSAHQKV